ncbi:ABC transporter substrate-binding protein [Streptosporangium saharense]|uniref:ABC transporter substrate-binding protein n=1 Tax=Streptosporangium saharense TaxID=1706840 RepID=UPI0036B74947
MRTTSPRVHDAEWQRIVDDLTRRGLFGAGAVLAASAVLAGCGSEEPRAQDTSGGGTLRYGWDGFTGQVPRDPRRVVVLDGRVDLEFAMLMGYPIVGAGTSWFPGERIGFQFPGRTIETAQPVNTAGDYRIDFERLLGLEPDLIVMNAYGYQSDWYGNERLATIAPLLVVGDDVPPYRDAPVNWRAALDRQSAQLGRTEQSRAATRDYDARLAALRPLLRERLGGRKIVLGVYAESGFLVHRRTLTTTVCAEAGLDLPFRDDHDAENGLSLSAEQLGRLDEADLIIAQVSDPAWRKATAANPVWARLPAVAAGKVIDTDARYNQGFALTATIFLDVLERAATLF